MLEYNSYKTSRSELTYCSATIYRTSHSVLGQAPPGAIEQSAAWINERDDEILCFGINAGSSLLVERWGRRQQSGIRATWHGHACTSVPLADDSKRSMNSQVSR